MICRMMIRSNNSFQQIIFNQLDSFQRYLQPKTFLAKPTIPLKILNTACLGQLVSLKHTVQVGIIVGIQLGSSSICCLGRSLPEGGGSLTDPGRFCVEEATSTGPLTNSEMCFVAVDLPSGRVGRTRVRNSFYSWWPILSMLNWNILEVGHP